MGKFSYLAVICVLAIDMCWAQIVFQEHMEQNSKMANAKGRKPLYAPSRCKKNELLYPGDQDDDWICDCAPASLYYPETDECYPAFRQGPCDPENILVLGLQQIIPECIANPCKVDGQIPIKNKCYEFNKAGPCKNANLSYVLGVDPNTLQVDCVKLSMILVNRWDDDSADPDKPTYNLDEVDLCARGTKRAIEGRCPA